MSAAIKPLESGELEDVDLENNPVPVEKDEKEGRGESKKRGQDQRRCRLVSPVCVVILLLLVLVLIIALSVKYARGDNKSTSPPADSSTTSDSTTTKTLSACSWQKVIPPDESEMKKFGAIMAVDGKTLAVGSQGDTANGKDSGAGYVFRFDKDTDQFLFDAKLIPHDGAEGDVALCTDVSGKFVALGAKKHDHEGKVNSGSVYIFMKKGNGEFVEEAELLPDELQAGDMLGNQLALDDKTLLVGARRTNEGRGVVYAYRRTEGRWKPYGQHGNALLPKEQLVDDEFGGRINFQGKTAVITKNGPNGYWSDAGGAYIFRDTGKGFEEVQELFPDEIDLDNFGKGAIDISDDETTVVVGAYKMNLDGTYKGYVYEYTLGEDGMYHQTDKIVPQDENEDYVFAEDVALRGNILLVLAQTAHEDGNTGLVYVFARESEGQEWVQQATLAPPENLPSSTDGFGASLAIIDDRTVIIGRRYSESSSGFARSGSVYVIKLC